MGCDTVQAAAERTDLSMSADACTVASVQSFSEQLQLQRIADDNVSPASRQRSTC
jgi:hypothetical protein